MQHQVVDIQAPSCHFAPVSAVRLQLWPRICSVSAGCYLGECKRNRVAGWVSDDSCGVESKFLPAGDDVAPAYRNIQGEHNAVYIGPDALMPLASVFAAVAGFVLMFWRRLVGALRLLVHKLSGRGAPQE
jgi:hypothetical protein